MKGEGAFRTISEVTQATGVAQHVLRYWESRFPQLRPLQRAGNRRYYRPDDVALVRRIDALLNQQGYTVKGVQKLLAEGATDTPAPADAVAPPAPTPPPVVEPDAALIAAIRAVRDDLARALAEDDGAPLVMTGQDG